MSDMVHKDIYIRLTDPRGQHKDVVNHHRVWDADRFLESQIDQYQGPKVKDDERRVVSIATQEEYKGARK